MSFLKDYDHLKIQMKDVLSATNNFASPNVIGVGGFGQVYKGELSLPQGPIMVAFKKLDRRLGQGNAEFWKEVMMLSKYKHENLISLMCYCIEGNDMILGYEYASRGSLDRHLSDASLTWTQRLKICVGAARGLNYLHDPRGAQQRVIHRDIKSGNILLDENWMAKVSDFGLSKAGPANQAQTVLVSNAVGTHGYCDPLYWEMGFLSKESDVYSFGVVLFEILCGRLCCEYNKGELTNILVPNWRWCYEENSLDEIIFPGLKEQMDPGSLNAFSAIAYQCVKKAREERPMMADVVRELEFALQQQQQQEVADLQIPFEDSPVLQIPLEEIVLATNNFHKENFIGEGTSEDHFYKGLLMRSEKQINVVARRFSSLNRKEIDFEKEISMLSSLKHKNLVSLVGLCLEKSEKIIIYENEVHKSLDQLLSDPTFTWPQRLKVCLGVADALRYIHYDFIHCDINSSKIFIDKNWEAKVFGFELSTKYPVSWMHRLLFSHYFDMSSGCKDPDYVGTKSVTPKYDVYAFGVILFEVLCGRKAIMTTDVGVSPSLAEMAMDHYKERNIDKIIDPDLRKQMDSQSLETFSRTAYRCLRERVRRPAMDEVFRELEDASKLQQQHDIQVPSKPVNEATSSNNLKEKMMIPLSVILSATDDFNPDLVIGQGGFALVYRAELYRSDIPSLSSMKGKKKNESSKITVAVKRIFSRSDKKGENHYLAEIELLTKCEHDNIVSLLGYCKKDSEMILVYEYAFKGTLGDYFCKPPKLSTNLSWVQRIEICLDIARGLEYLHTNMDGKPCIVHRDIKSDNILLDKDMKAKITDFGLSRFFSKSQEMGFIETQNIVGTSVYTDPEFLTTKRYRRESDMYSFGVVLFEMLSGTMAYDQIYLEEHKNGLAHIARRRFIEGTLKELIDPKIIEEDEDHIFSLNRGPNQESLDAFSNIAYQCLAGTHYKRPTIEVVITGLKRALELQGETLVLTRFQLNDIESAIKSSAERNSIGSDASGGIVYKAKLHYVCRSSLSIEEKNNAELEKEPMDVAIKHISNREDGQGDQQRFFEEIDVLTRCKHGNIVSLLGFCDECREMILVFEDASNGSLGDYLRKTNNKATATWAQRLKWCLDIARGLNHLHTKMGGAQGIIHGDIKSANILIGKNSKAKIAYYGLSKSHQANQVAIDNNNNVGTNVYLDPEYEKTGKLNKESDIFSFGVVLFELFCGRLADDLKFKEENDKGLAPIARQGFNDGTIIKMIDPKLKEENDEDIFTSNRGPNQDSLNKFLYIAKECLEETPKNRPKMEAVIQGLEIALNFQENFMTRL